VTFRPRCGDERREQMPEETRLEGTAVWCAGSRFGKFHMQIRCGFDVALSLAQPTTILAMTILAMMDVHSDLRHCIAEETELEVAPAIAAERFVDDSGNIVRRLSAPAGPVSLWLQGVFRSDGREDEVDTTAEAVAAPDLSPDALPFLRPSRYC
jgi:hypothetical protein